MQFRPKTAFTFAFVLAAPAFSGWAIAADTPSVVTPTRPEMKEFLEKSKQSDPRLPLPPVSDEDAALAKARGAKGPMAGILNNARMRRYYLPAEVINGGFTREPDPAMTLDNTFKTMFFWIVSRANNCAYCMGHQEVKLAGDGVSEDGIAALDGDWSEFNDAQRAAFGFTRKLTFEPNALTDADIDRLRPYYKDLQILEIITAVGGFNAMNRWTGALKIPQEDHRVYLTPTSEKYKSVRSRVAPLDPSSASGPMTCARPATRGALESRSAVEAALSAARTRSPRLPLASDEAARKIMPADAPSGPAPEWVRLLANFPLAGKSWVGQHYGSQTKGRLSPKLKAEIAWVSARNDRAWYALGVARDRLRELGLSDDAIFALDAADGAGLPEAERPVVALAKKLTVDPALVTDADIAALRKLYSDHEVAEIVFQTTQASFFDRLTEAANLKLEK